MKNTMLRKEKRKTDKKIEKNLKKKNEGFKKVIPTSLKSAENKLWAVFSVYIRLRDSNSQGIGSCFTCGKLLHWTKGDCGHGIPRQHKATKFNEWNNHLQCKRCNGFEGGARER